MKDFDKVLTSLNLSTSDTRESAYKSLIKSVLFIQTTPVSLDVIKKVILETYEFEPYSQELSTYLTQLDDSGEITYRDGVASLKEETKKEIKNKESLAKKEEEKRFLNFKSFLLPIYNETIKADDYEIIWRGFLQYLYQCFFHYGERAVYFVHPVLFNDQNKKLNNTEILSSIITELDRPDLLDVLKFTIDNFQNFASAEDIDFIDGLGQKTLSFSSLGLDPSLAEDGLSSNLIDWVLFLDTNFLFSILDLHVNVEDEACKELIKLLANNVNYIKVKLYYSDLTLKELKRKKDDFTFIEEDLTKPAIRALLKSEELDEFSRRYYEDLLKDPENTIHPTTIVDIAHTTLQNKRIEIFNTGPQIRVLDDNYINVRIEEYQRYISNLNDYRRESYQEKPIGRPPRELYRSDSQKEHDITLREVILLLRSAIKNKDYKTLNHHKYYGVTLDDLLVRYDSYEIRKKGQEDYPTFFKPSYLLNKLIKLLPVKTDNYKKAFIKAVSARGFNKDIKKSSQVIKIATYLKNQGIDNEEILLNIITEKVFLEKYKEESDKEDFNEKEFFEAEINKLYNKKQEELEQAKGQLQQLEVDRDKSETEKRKLTAIKKEKEEAVQLYSTAVKQLQQKIDILESKIARDGSLPKLQFEEEATKRKAQELEKELNIEKQKRLNRENESRAEKRKKFIQKEDRKWQARSILFFILTLTPFIIYIAYLYNNYEDQSMTFIESLKQNSILNIGLPILLLLINIFTGRLIYDRFFNESIKKVFKDNIEIPANLKELKDIRELE